MKYLTIVTHFVYCNPGCGALDLLPLLAPAEKIKESQRVTRFRIKKGKETEMDKFWMVFGVGMMPPVVQHITFALAREEAMRLARQHEGTKFVVLESRGYYVRKDTTWIPHD